MYPAWLLIIATGAILRYAVADSVEGVDIALIGLILMAVGAVGFLVSLIAYMTNRADYDTGRTSYPPREP